jgi:hypothetical protein
MSRGLFLIFCSTVGWRGSMQFGSSITQLPIYSGSDSLAINSKYISWEAYSMLRLYEESL